MTEEVNAEEVPGMRILAQEDDPDGYSPEDLFTADVALHALLVAVLGYGVDGDGRIDLTFVFDGVPVSGTVVPPAVWQRGVIRTLRSAGIDRTENVSDELLEEWDVIARGLEHHAYTRMSAGLHAPAPLHIHMEDVVIGSPAGARIPFWRGLRSEITGWSLGKM